MENQYVEVVIDLPVQRLNKIFHYRVPTHLQGCLTLGQRVVVPLQNRTVEGYIVGFAQEGERTKELKEVQGIIDPAPHFNAETLALAQWMSEYYHCYLSEALRCMVPPGGGKIRAKRSLMVSLAVNEKDAETVLMKQLIKRAPKQAAVLRTLLSYGELTIEQLREKHPVDAVTLRQLEKKGLINCSATTVERNPMSHCHWQATCPLTLTPEQQTALDAICKNLDQSSAATMLLHGVTGSGKTEVYLQAIAHALKLGRQAIVLVPEISLTPQMIERFKGRFGDDVAVLHSRLSPGERYDSWYKIYHQEAKIAVGARSAVFAPFRHLGLIIIDEEHENSYKQEESPRYHAREVAIERARLVGAVVVLGSATPSIESYYKAQRGEYQLLELTRRIDDRPLPDVQIIDMRQQLKKQNKSIFSQQLQTLIADRIAKSEQIILFLNRRGFATFVLCRDCGLVLRCPHCEVALTYHAEERSLCCHYCDFKRPAPDLCPKCQSRHIRYFGTGTERIQEELGKLFPGIRILRMDVDTTRRKGAHEQILTAFRQGKADVLIGTQMIAKGLDFPRVTLVGVITADTALNLPDFRAGERTFQLLMQVAGRAGRGNKPGEVVIQTYNPEHYSVVAAQSHNYRSFYLQELRYRAETGYPPFTHLVNIVISHHDEAKVKDDAERLGSLLNEAVVKYGEKEKICVLGPCPTPMRKIRNQYRWQIILKGTDFAGLRQILREMQAAAGKYLQQIKLSIDVDPLGMI